MNIAECAVTLAVALIVFGPKRLPMLIKHAAAIVAWITGARGRLMQEMGEYLKTVQLKENLKKAEKVDELYQKQGDSGE